ncbi:MAG: alpha/beta hydrolase [Chloroflexota bacterium]|nr:alpha/beta hydrolase [Chloroflexota bacterium]
MNEFLPPGAVTGPHQNQPVLLAGEPLATARAALLLLHGRGASAQDILTLVPELEPQGFTCIAPQAVQSTWYPNSFLAPIESNEPWLSSALSVIGAVLAQVQAAGIPAERTMLLGFSQGACLALTYVARHAQRYSSVVGLSGGLIGPDMGGHDYAGSLAGTPVFLGCSDVDPHIPKERVQLAAKTLELLGGVVTARLYPRMGHTINQDELEAVKAMMAV